MDYICTFSRPKMKLHQAHLKSHCNRDVICGDLNRAKFYWENVNKWLRTPTALLRGEAKRQD